MIANEGKIILIPTVIVLILGLVSNYIFFDGIAWIKIFNYVVFMFLVFSLYFFREPNIMEPDLHTSLSFFHL